MHTGESFSCVRGVRVCGLFTGDLQIKRQSLCRLHHEKVHKVRTGWGLAIAGRAGSATHDDLRYEGTLMVVDNCN